MAQKKKTSIQINANDLSKISGISQTFISDQHFLAVLQQLIDALPVILVLIDPKDYSIVLANTHIAKSLNVPVERLIGKSFLDFLPPGEVRERRKAYADRTILNKKPTKLIDKRGDRYFDNYTYPVLDSNGDVIYAIAIMNEITEKKGLEASLADKEQLFSSLIQNSKDFFYVISEEGTVIYQCPSVEEKFGYAKDSKGRSIFEHIHPDDKDFVKRSFAEVLPKPGKSKMIDFRVLDSNGRIVHVEAIANNQLHNKSINGIIINARDITERVRTKQQLTKTVSYLENIINSVSELVFCLTSKGKVLLWNDQIVQLTGFSARSMIGKNLFANSIVEDKESFKTYLETCVRKLTKPYDLKIRTKHDEYRLIRIQGSVVKTDNETDRSIVFTGKDITYDTEIHGSLITGSSYLIPETSNEKAIQLLNGLLREGYTGLIITRDDSEDDLFDTVGKNRSLTTYYFSKADTVSPDDHSIPDPETLITDVSHFISTHERSIVLIDRLDFLIALYGFKTVMQAIYSISSSATRENGIVLIRLNPDIVSPFELTILSEELKRLPEQNIERITLDNELYEILQYINEKNQNKILVSYKNISTQFSITKVTTAKRITSLSDKDLLIIKKKGRLKTIHITTKGKNLLQRRPVI